MTGDSLNIAEMNVDELQRRLTDREHLVEELTSRLEQAAEQLDRLKRSGADRGGRGFPGIPPELVAQQQALTEELQIAVQQWAEMQPTELLARVEMQVAELRDLMVDRLETAALSLRTPADVPSPGTAALNRQAAAPGEPAKPATPITNLGRQSSYEAFKAGLLETDDDGSPAEPAQPTANAPAATVEPKTDHKRGDSRPLDVPAVDPPAAVDFQTATLDDLRAAVDGRDSYIAYLIRRLRAAESSLRPSGSWSELESVPDELRSRLEEYERNLDESLRLAEVETSLERARLGREAARLEHLSDQLRKKIVQLGLANDDSDESDNAEGSDPGLESAKGHSRWFRLFGK